MLMSTLLITIYILLHISSDIALSVPSFTIPHSLKLRFCNVRLGIFDSTYSYVLVLNISSPLKILFILILVALSRSTSSSANTYPSGSNSKYKSLPSASVIVIGSVNQYLCLSFSNLGFMSTCIHASFFSELYTSNNSSSFSSSLPSFITVILSFTSSVPSSEHLSIPPLLSMLTTIAFNISLANSSFGLSIALIVLSHTYVCKILRSMIYHHTAFSLYFSYSLPVDIYHNSTHTPLLHRICMANNKTYTLHFEYA